MYPLNWPLAIPLGKLGVPLTIKVNIAFDEESQTYYATSPSLRGLAVEAESLDELKREIEDCVPTLFELNHAGSAARATSHIRYRTYAEMPV